MATRCRDPSEKSQNFAIPLETRTQWRFKRYILALENVYPHSLVVWYDRAQYCGVLRINRLCDFNFEFEPQKLPAGMIVLISEDETARLLLDFDEDDLIVEASGVWADIKY